LPFLTLAYQISAKEAGEGAGGHAFGPAWFEVLVNNHWAQALLGFRDRQLAAWMVVLAEMKLSAAFSLRR